MKTQLQRHLLKRHRTKSVLFQVNQVKHHLQIIGDGEVFPYCCNFDSCNLDMCTAMGLPKGDSRCTTTIEHKLRELSLLNNDVEIISNGNQVKKWNREMNKGLYINLYSRQLLLKALRNLWPLCKQAHSLEEPLWLKNLEEEAMDKNASTGAWLD